MLFYPFFRMLTARMTGRESQADEGKREFYEELCKI
jgi:hypothetical protein